MKRFLLSVVASVFALLTAAAQAQEIKIGLPVMSLELLPILAAQEQGFFAKHGIKSEVIVFRGGGVAMAAFVSGEIPVVATGFPQVALMRAKGVDAVLFFNHMPKLPFGLVARKDLNITSISQIKGMSVAVTSPGSLTDMIGRYLIAKQGWDPKKDVGFVTVGGGGELFGALVGKKVDTAVLMEPFLSMGVTQGTITTVVDVAEALDAFASAPLTTTRSFLQKSPKEIKAVHAGMMDALAFIHNDRQGALAFAQKKFPGTKPEVLAPVFDRLEKLWSRDGKFTPDNIRITQEICRDLGVTKDIIPFDEVVAKLDLGS
jgi:NitT/TauT family transport system substrate-binding protein